MKKVNKENVVLAATSSVSIIEMLEPRVLLSADLAPIVSQHDLIVEKDEVVRIDLNLQSEKIIFDSLSLNPDVSWALVNQNGIGAKGYIGKDDFCYNTAWCLSA